MVKNINIGFQPTKEFGNINNSLVVHSSSSLTNSFQCVFCQELASFQRGDFNKFQTHLKTVHRAWSEFDVLFAINLIDRSEKDEIIRKAIMKVKMTLEKREEEIKQQSMYMNFTKGINQSVKLITKQYETNSENSNALVVHSSSSLANNFQCVLCKELASFQRKDFSKFQTHLETVHRAWAQCDVLFAINFIDRSEKDDIIRKAIMKVKMTLRKEDDNKQQSTCIDLTNDSDKVIPKLYEPIHIDRKSSETDKFKSTEVFVVMDSTSDDINLESLEETFETCTSPSNSIIANGFGSLRWSIKPSNYHCLKCGRIFNTKRGLFRHKEKRKHDCGESAASKIWSCEKCGHIFTEKKYFKRHTESRKYSCETKCVKCNQEFKLPSELRYHVKRCGVLDHHDARIVKCEKCRKMFASRNALEGHERRKYGCETICKKCNKRCKRPRDLVMHMKRIDCVKINYKCEDCSKEFPNRTRFKVHRARKNSCFKVQSSKFKCEDCPKEFKTIRLFDTHKRRRRGCSKFNPTCDNCFRWFGDMTRLELHKKKKKTCKKMFACPKCGKLIEESKYEKHSTGYGCNKEVDLKCIDCLKTFTNKRIARKHYERNAEQKVTCRKRFECEKCGKKMSEERSKAHRCYRPVQKYDKKCNKCLRNFSTRQSAERHKSIYDKCRIRKQCEQCKRKIREVNYQNHITKHCVYLESEFKCPDCLSILINKKCAMRHVMNKEAACHKRIACFKCGKKFREELYKTHKTWDKICLKDEEKCNTLKQFVCKGCQKQFVKENDLIHHQKKNRRCLAFNPNISFKRTKLIHSEYVSKEIKSKPIPINKREYESDEKHKLMDETKTYNHKNVKNNDINDKVTKVDTFETKKKQTVAGVSISCGECDNKFHSLMQLMVHKQKQECAASKL